MQWEVEAERVLGKVPALVRPFVRKRVEEFGRARGAERITAELFEQARREVGPSKTRDSGGPSPEAIEQLESRLLDEQAEKRRTRTYHVRVCAGAVGCPRSLIPVEAIADALVEEIEASGFSEHLVRGREGRPILSHHRFQAAVAGCANACSQPHICDFGVIGRTEPVLLAERCTACGNCVTACQEDAIVLRDDLPVIAVARCIGCGDCVRACLTEALQSGPATYRVLAGGKLGRHPRLAMEIAIMTNPREVRARLAAALAALIRKGKPGERLGALIEREEGKGEE